jgi:hypothetical protein
VGENVNKLCVPAHISGDSSIVCVCVFFLIFYLLLVRSSFSLALRLVAEKR